MMVDYMHILSFEPIIYESEMTPPLSYSIHGQDRVCMGVTTP